MCGEACECAWCAGPADPCTREEYEAWLEREAIYQEDLAQRQGRWLAEMEEMEANAQEWDAMVEVLECSDEGVEECYLWPSGVVTNAPF